MIKKVRRRKIVIKQRELVVVRHDAAAPEICPVCRRPLAPELGEAAAARRLPDAAGGTDEEGNSGAR